MLLPVTCDVFWVLLWDVVDSDGGDVVEVEVAVVNFPPEVSADADAVVVDVAIAFC